MGRSLGASSTTSKGEIQHLSAVLGRQAQFCTESPAGSVEHREGLRVNERGRKGSWRQGDRPNHLGDPET